MPSSSTASSSCRWKEPSVDHPTKFFPRFAPPDTSRGPRQMSLLAEKNRAVPGAAAHTDSAKAFVPDQSRAERKTSYAVDDFAVPGGREEEWRFTPVDRLSSLFQVAA